MTVDIRRKEPINFERKRLVRPDLGAPKPKFNKGFGGSIASMSKPEMYGRFRGQPEIAGALLESSIFEYW